MGSVFFLCGVGGGPKFFRETGGAVATVSGRHGVVLSSRMICR